MKDLFASVRKISRLFLFGGGVGVFGVFENREDPGNEVGERPIGLPRGICPRFSRCIFLPLQLRYFYFEAQKNQSEE